MILVDSHCHLDCLKETTAEALRHAQEAGVKAFLCVCITQKDFASMRQSVEAFPNVFLSVGTHPNEILDREPSPEEMLELANTTKVVAIGETGLDYYRTEGDVSWQQLRFRQHIQVAKMARKPLIVHTRNARHDTIQILKEENAQAISGVLHCFTENFEMAKQAMDLGFFISFSGIITFQNAKELREVAKQVPLDRMLIETDSPYLAPVPFRGHSNQPAYVRYVAEKIAEIKQLPLEQVANQTSQNFFDLFKIPPL